MTDDEELMDDAQEALQDEIDEAVEEAVEDFVQGEDAVAAEHAEALAEARAERLARQAFLFGVDKQLFTFLFANCLFFAGALACWGRVAVWDGGVPIRDGLDTIRGAMIFALSIYGFWTAYFNIYGGQMKVWPYLINALIALWAGIGGIMGAFAGNPSPWDKAGAYLDTPGLKKILLDDITVRLSTIAPGYWLVTLGGVIVLWVILSGLKKGASGAKSARAAAGGAGGRSRRR